MGIVIDIPRSLEQQIEAQLGKQNAILLYGTQGTGKTTIIEHIAAKYANDTLLLQGEDMQIRKYCNEELLQIIWNLHDGQEIDLLELNNGQLQAIECKWQNRKTKVPVAFSKAYPDANFAVISNENYLEWIT